MFYWYFSYSKPKPSCDIILHAKKGTLYGFKEEATYEVVEAHDLRGGFRATIESALQTLDTN